MFNMHSLRRWLYAPRKQDPSKLAMFYFANEELIMVTSELDSFDGRTDPERCSILVTQLRICQDKVLSICNDIMDEAIPDLRANRDFRIKFPDDVLHENLAGQLWFGAECLAAGSNIVQRELESASLRPLAKALTRSLDNVRTLLKDQCLRNPQLYSEKVKEALRIFDRLFAEFELCYVSAMVSIKSAKEYHLQQEIIVLFSETLIRGLKMGLIEQDMVDDCDPSLMFTIPRLAIVWGLVIFTDGPFNVDQEPENLSELFRPFYNLLLKIRDLLWTLTKKELTALEHMLCSQDEPKGTILSDSNDNPLRGLCDFITEYCAEHNSKYFSNDFFTYDLFDDKATDDSNREGSTSRNYSLVRNLILKNLNEERPKAESSSALRHRVNSVSNNPTASSKADESSSSDGRSDAVTPRSEVYSQNLVASSNTDRHALGKVVRHPVFETRVHSKIDTISLSSENINPPPLTVHNVLAPSYAHSLESDLDRSHSDFWSYNHCRDILSRKHHLAQDLRRTSSCIELVPSNKNFNFLLEGELTTASVDKLSQSFPTHYDRFHFPGSSRSKYDTSFCKRRKISKNQSEVLRIQSSTSCNSPNSGWTRENLNSMQFISNSYTHSGHNTPRKQARSRQPNLCQKPDSQIQQNHYSSCQSVLTNSSAEWISSSPETSSYNSECHDDEEIALALQAAEIASQSYARSRFENSSELLHKLFVCVSGVADQLQTNYASDLRNILKCVFDMNCSQSLHGDNEAAAKEFSPCMEAYEHENACEIGDDDCSDDSTSKREPSLDEDFLGAFDCARSLDQMEDDARDHSSVDSAQEALPNNNNNNNNNATLFIVNMEDENSNLGNNFRVPPIWLPDEFSSQCMACEVPFTLIRRRHHCRNCGKLFCSRCSSNSMPLPRFGHLKPVRVCNPCFTSPVANLLQPSQS